jgi:hypothetical protein
VLLAGRAIAGEAAVAHRVPDMEAAAQQLLELRRRQMWLDRDLNMLTQLAQRRRDFIQLALDIRLRRRLRPAQQHFQRQTSV